MNSNQPLFGVAAAGGALQRAEGRAPGPVLQHHGRGRGGSGHGMPQAAENLHAREQTGQCFFLMAFCLVLRWINPMSSLEAHENSHVCDTCPVPMLRNCAGSCKDCVLS